MIALERDERRLLFFAQLEKPKFQTTLSDKQSEFDELARPLTLPFLFELGPGGAVRSARMSDHPSGLVVGIRRTLIAALQGENRTPLASWQAVETDPMGRYLARYERGDGNQFKKTKLSYFAITPSGDPTQTRGVTVTPAVKSASGSVTINASGEVEAVELAETVEASTDRTLPIATDSSITLRSSSSMILAKTALPPYADLFAHGTLIDAQHPWIAPFETRSDDARIGGRTFEQVLTAVHALEGTPEPTVEAEKNARQNQRADLFEALEALVRRKHGTVAAMQQLIVAGDAAQITLMDALGASGSGEAQQALVDLIRGGKLDAKYQKAAAIALSRSEAPTKQGIEGLKAMLEIAGLRVQALYGLGTTVRHLREHGDEKGARRVLDFILARLAAAQSDAQKITALRAIANSGHEAALPALRPFLTSTNAQLRAAAVEALQVMNVPEAAPLIADSIAHDASPDVRQAALRAAFVHEPSALVSQSVVTAAHADAEPHVRLQALQLLIAWLPAEPRLRPDVERVASEDQQAEIRRAATDALTHS